MWNADWCVFLSFNPLFGLIPLAGKQILEYQGLELQDFETLVSYLVSDNSVIRLSGKALEYLFVRMSITGENINFFIDFDAPVSHLQEMVKQRNGIQFGMKRESPLFSDCTNCVLL
jgi:hypothetical protein